MTAFARRRRASGCPGSPQADPPSSRGLPPTSRARRRRRAAGRCGTGRGARRERSPAWVARGHQHQPGSGSRSRRIHQHPVGVAQPPPKRSHHPSCVGHAHVTRCWLPRLASGGSRRMAATSSAVRPRTWRWSLPGVWLCNPAGSSRGRCAFGSGAATRTTFAEARRAPRGENMQADRQLAEAMQVGHALIMLAELPDHSANAAYPIAVRIACLESFYSSLRLMFEFLIDKPKRGHIHRHDYLLGWTRPPATRSTPFGGGRGSQASRCHIWPGAGLRPVGPSYGVAAGDEAAGCPDAGRHAAVRRRTRSLQSPFSTDIPRIRR